ncbi:MAG: hypothetical protein R3A44_44660 [Caldilineaceae bacterium]
MSAGLSKLRQIDSGEQLVGENDKNYFYTRMNADFRGFKRQNGQKNPQKSAKSVVVKMRVKKKMAHAKPPRRKGRRET